MVLDGRATAQDSLRQAVDAFLDDRVSDEDRLHWGFLASGAALALWDFPRWAELTNRHLQFARASGALATLSAALNGSRMLAIFAGDFNSAASLGAQELAVKELTGARKGSYGALLLAAYQGRPAEASRVIDASARDARDRGEGLGLHHAYWATAVLNNGLGRYVDAMLAAEQAVEEKAAPFVSACALPELVEAAAKSGEMGRAANALRRLSAMTDVEGSDWAAGIQMRSRALMSSGSDAENCYAEAVQRLGLTPLRPDLARAHLLYGEWLRRESRRAQARHELRIANDLFTTIGAGAFAERTRRELLATGEKLRKRDVDAVGVLTPQEEHIARLAREGRTNPEIGAELFLSGRTVEWHLRKIFMKLGITSRKELYDALPPRQRRSTSESHAHDS